MADQVKPRPQQPPPPAPDNRNSAKRRRDYRTANPICQGCDFAPSEHVHEITSGVARHYGEPDPDVQLVSCGDCHGWLHDKEIWPIERQIVLKLRVIVRKVNQYRGRSQSAIKMKDLIPVMDVEA